MDLVSFFAPLLGISFLVERILEGAFSIVEAVPAIKEWKNDPDRDYGEAKLVASVVVGLLLGVVATSMIGVGFLSQIEALSEIDTGMDILLTGAIAGALAPYSHQIMQALLQLQKLLRAQKEKIEKGTPPPQPGTGS